MLQIVSLIHFLENGRGGGGTKVCYKDIFCNNFNALETKRVAFPRFFFISDEDLLDILARSRDPENFQKHLNKCFEAINSVELTSKNNI